MQPTFQHVCFACLVLVGCESGDALDGANDTDSSGESADASVGTTAITTTGPVTGASNDDTARDPPPPGISCEMCIYGWCRDEYDGCLADANCSCWLTCGQTMSDEQCFGLCGAPGPAAFVLLACIQVWCGPACAQGGTAGPTDTGETGDATGSDETGSDETGPDATTSTSGSESSTEDDTATSTSG